MTFLLFKGIARKRQLTHGDIVIASIAALILTAGMALFDIMVYGTYVFPIFGCTNPANANQQFCQSVNTTTTYTIPGLGTIPINGFQTYWIIFTGVDLFFAGTVAFNFAIHAKSPKIFIVYLFTIAGPFFFGLEDLMFYWFQNQTLPASWPWLDGMGWGWNLFLSQLLSPGVQHVTTNGIYFALATLVGGLALVWKIAFRLQK